ncbi:MAG: lipopolysaccharide heptosyltransferase II [Verrucomicrobiota bacterium]
MPKSKKPDLAPAGSRGGFGQRLAYLAYRGFEGFLGLLPIGVCFGLGMLAGRIAHLLLPKYRSLARRNLRIAFEGEKSEREVKSLARQHFGRLGANLVSSIKLGTMSEDKAQARLDTDDACNLEKFVYLIPHMGNWEILTRTQKIAPSAGQIGSLYQPLSNPFLDALVRRRRESNGVKLFDRRDGFFAPIKWLGPGGVLGVLVDQHAGDKGIWAPFFGRLASTTNLVALIARRAKVPMIPVGIVTVGWARWKLITGDELASGTDSDETTARMNVAMEKIIRQSPADWFWVHNRWKTPNPAFLLRRYKRGIALAPNTTTDDLKPFRMLVRSPNWLGDACMAVPAARAIKHGRPDLKLTVLCNANLKEMWETIPEVDVVLTRVKKESPFRVARTLKAEGPFDVALLLPNSVRSALEVWLAGIPKRIGYAGHRRRWMLNQIIPEPKNEGPPRHHAERYIHMAKRIGADMGAVPRESPKTPQGWGYAPRQRLGICAGAEYGPAKRWFPERFAEAAKRVKAQLPGCELVLFGGPKDVEIGAEISRMLEGDCRNLSGKTTMRELIDELHQCTALLTNDTGTMHLAAALGVPTISIFGSTEPAWTAPAGSNHRILRHHVECSPCFLRECPMDMRCMKAVEVEEAVSAVMETVAPVT